MKKNRTATSHPTSRAAGLSASLPSLLVAAGSAYAVWVIPSRLSMAPDALSQWGYMLGLAAAVIVMAFTLAAALAGLGLSHDSAARSAVMGSFALALASWIWSSPPGNGAAYSVWLVPVIGMAALCGGFMASVRSDGFVENNAPPSRKVQEDVLRWHRQVIGDPPGLPPSKRAFDIFLAGIGLLVSLPLWLSFGALIWLESPGPVVFVKNSVGKGGRNFHQYKFRTMVRGAEHDSGPVLAEKKDERILRTGSFLRKTALDELPQLVNILKGEMSFVGPRPQRTVLVHQYLQDIPDYSKRHQLPPGLAGLAQVAGGYDIAPREKLKWDLLYIERVSLLYDLWLLGLAFALVFWLRWRKDALENGLPRSWLHLDRDKGH